MQRLLPLGLFLGCGCVLRGNVESLEARLREQENLNADYQRQVDELEQELSVAQREIDILRRNVAAEGAQLAAFETQRALAEVVGIKFNTLLTAAQNLGGDSGTERLHAVIYPHDADGEIVKVAGDLSLEAIDPTLPEGARSVGKWEIPAERNKSVWHSGFLSTGFLIESDWNIPPQGSVIILHARFSTPDGRKFDATHTVSRKSGAGSGASRTKVELPAASMNRLDEGALRSQSPDDAPPAAPWSNADRRASSRIGLKTSDSWTMENFPFRR